MNRDRIKTKRTKRFLDHKRERAAARAALAGGRTRLVQPEKWGRRPALPPVLD